MAWVGRLVLEITPQAHDEIVDRARVGVLPYTPDLLEDHLARHGPAFVLDEKTEQRCLHQGERHGLVTYLDLELLEVDRPLAEREPAGDLGRGRLALEAAPEPIAPAQQAAHPGDENRQLERLRQIVVGA